jgi:hypothetical protein
MEGEQILAGKEVYDTILVEATDFVMLRKSFDNGWSVKTGEGVFRKVRRSFRADKRS